VKGQAVQRPVDLRRAGAAMLAGALQSSRQDTLRTFEAYAAGLDPLDVPLRGDLNPPLWELGHIGWFQEYWTTRNPQWRRGALADPQAPRGPSMQPAADALYDSSRVVHTTRWSLPLPGAEQTRGTLAAQLDAVLDMLAGTDGTDDALYFFRLALFHEDMHHEAALYMAQALGIDVLDRLAARRSVALRPAPLQLPAGQVRLGSESDSAGFAFDNELTAHEVSVDACELDATVVRWRDYLPFVAAGGYADPRHWSDEGWQWLQQAHLAQPRYLRQVGGQWQEARCGRWQALDLGLPACHLTCHEAEAWCRWAGRRLPTEAEWSYAQHTGDDAFAWGEVWEWTASTFLPYPGFVPHPYRDYSSPWFGSRRVLRGASIATQPRMRHPQYRNYFTADRNDLFAGFRSCRSD
jgi:gamma-glutamyl hercynylcysteine S-oxide synthase